jgi:hypothetical protein
MEWRYYAVVPTQLAFQGHTDNAQKNRKGQNVICTERVQGSLSGGKHVCIVVQVENIAMNVATESEVADIKGSTATALSRVKQRIRTRGVDNQRSGWYASLSIHPKKRGSLVSARGPNNFGKFRQLSNFALSLADSSILVLR